ncbi:hypothetical protein [Promicromonospora soli]
MSTKDEVRDFLVSRRANVTPQQAGIPDFGGERRVPSASLSRRARAPRMLPRSSRGVRERAGGDRLMGRALYAPHFDTEGTPSRSLPSPTAPPGAGSPRG